MVVVVVGGGGEGRTGWWWWGGGGWWWWWWEGGGMPVWRGVRRSKPPPPHPSPSPGARAYVTPSSAVSRPPPRVSTQTAAAGRCVVFDHRLKRACGGGLVVVQNVAGGGGGGIPAVNADQVCRAESNQERPFDASMTYLQNKNGRVLVLILCTGGRRERGGGGGGGEAPPFNPPPPILRSRVLVAEPHVRVSPAEQQRARSGHGPGGDGRGGAPPGRRPRPRA
jgi:hypothetical protein